MAKQPKRLYRTKKDAKIFGVCAGLADYFEIDVTIVRLGWVILALAAGGGILAYLIAAVIIPEKPAK